MSLWFLVPDASARQPGDTVELTGQEAHHAASVRRVRVGEQIVITDGAGVVLSGDCTSVSPQRVTMRVAHRDEVPRPNPRVVLVQALAKGDRDERAVQMATELGVDQIVPWQAERSISRWTGPKIDRGVQRWASIASEAAKQAHRAWVPQVQNLATTEEVGALVGFGQVLLLDPNARDLLTDAVRQGAASDLFVVVGPEGGISPAELDHLQAAGGQPVRLGNTVLRTSTAGAAALVAVDVALGRW